MLETLKVPYPKAVGLPVWVSLLDALVRLFALAAICRLARPRLQGLSRTSAALSAALLLIMLNETFRVFFIESAIVGSVSYSALDNAPRALSWFAAGAGVAWLGLGNQKPRNATLAIVLIAALMVIAIHPALDVVFAALKTTLPEPTPLYSGPYPFKIDLLIFTTFIEPTVSAFVMASSCWSELRGSAFRRTLAFTALLLLVRGRYTALLVESFWVRQPLPTAFLAESQFFLETLTLGLLVALAWSCAERINGRWAGTARLSNRAST
jgi:hypothetical protein